MQEARYSLRNRFISTTCCGRRAYRRLLVGMPMSTAGSENERPERACVCVFSGGALPQGGHGECPIDVLRPAPLREKRLQHVLLNASKYINSLAGCCSFLWGGGQQLRSSSANNALLMTIHALTNIQIRTANIVMRRQIRLS